MATVASSIPLTSPVPVTRARRARWFFTLLPIGMAVAVFVGFSPTYYLKAAYGTRALTALYQTHGLLFTCWMLLIIAQPALVAMRRTDLHRRIGVGASVLVVAMMIAAYAVTVDLGRRGTAPPGVPPIVFLIVPFSTLIVFPVLVGAAFLQRRVPETHKRLMLIATLELVPAGFGRWPVIAPLGPLAYFGLTDLFIVAILIYDRATLGRFHRATMIGGGFLVASQVARMIIGGTEIWQSFAHWLIA